MVYRTGKRCLTLVEVPCCGVRCKYVVRYLHHTDILHGGDLFNSSTCDTLRLGLSVGGNNVITSKIALSLKAYFFLYGISMTL